MSSNSSSSTGSSILFVGNFVVLLDLYGFREAFPWLIRNLGTALKNVYFRTQVRIVAITMRKKTAVTVRTKKTKLGKENSEKKTY